MSNMTKAAQDVLAERRRQIEAEGWTPEHDDAYGGPDLAAAAACYAIGSDEIAYKGRPLWPWKENWWKPSGYRRDLVKAGALILAEIERLDRAHGIGGSDDQAEPKREPLSDAQLASVCLSYRHDFGLLNKDEQARLMLEARDWERAFRKEWQREPLSDDDINKLAWKQNIWTDGMVEFSFLAFAREVERAHGIGGSDDK